MAKDAEPPLPTVDRPPGGDRRAASTPGRQGSPHAVHVTSPPAELEWAATHDASEVLDRLGATEAGLAASRLGTCGPTLPPTMAHTGLPAWPGGWLAPST